MSRILHVLRDLSRNGGVQRLVHDMALAAPTMGHRAEVMVFHQTTEPSYTEALQNAGIRVHTVAAWDFVRQKKIFAHADVVHAHLFPALYCVGLWCPGGIYTEHNTTNNRRKLWWSRRIERWIYSRYRCVTCISPEVQAELHRFWGSPPPTQTRVVYNGIDIDHIALEIAAQRQSKALPPGEPRPKPPQEEFRIAMLGSLSPKKDQATLIRAVSQLPGNAALFLAGQGPQESELRQLTQSLGIAHRVHFRGVISDVTQFLTPMHAYVQSSHWEGFGLAAIEAMACGLPVLCSNVPGLNNLSQDSVNLFNPGDVSGLARSLLRVQEDPIFRERLIALGRNTAQRFSLTQMLSQLQEIYCCKAGY